LPGEEAAPAADVLGGGTRREGREESSSLKRKGGGLLNLLPTAGDFDITFASTPPLCGGGGTAAAPGDARSPWDGVFLAAVRAGPMWANTLLSFVYRSRE